MDSRADDHIPMEPLAHECAGHVLRDVHQTPSHARPIRELRRAALSEFATHEIGADIMQMTHPFSIPFRRGAFEGERGWSGVPATWREHRSGTHSSTHRRIRLQNAH